MKGSVADEEEERDDYACLGASYVVLSSAINTINYNTSKVEVNNISTKDPFAIPALKSLQIRAMLMQVPHQKVGVPIVPKEWKVSASFPIS